MSDAVIAAARNVDGNSTVLIFDGFRMGGHKVKARLRGEDEPDRTVVVAWDGRSFVKVVEGLYDEVLIHFGEDEIRLKVAPWDFILDAQAASPEPEPEIEIPENLPDFVQEAFEILGGIGQEDE